MIENLYCYIEEFRSLGKVEMNFGGKFRGSYNRDTNILTLTDDPDYIEYFFGDRIHNVSAIVGKNGTGKSALLEWLINSNRHYYSVKIQIMVYYIKNLGQIVIRTNIDKGFEVKNNTTTKHVQVYGINEGIDITRKRIIYFTNSIYDRVEYDSRSAEPVDFLTMRNELKIGSRRDGEEFWEGIKGREYVRILALLQSKIKLGDVFPAAKYITVVVTRDVEEMNDRNRPVRGRGTIDGTIEHRTADEVVEYFQAIAGNQDKRGQILLMIERYLLFHLLARYVPDDKWKEENFTLKVTGINPGDLSRQFGAWLGPSHDYSMLLDSLSEILNTEDVREERGYYKVPIDNIQPGILGAFFQACESCRLTPTDIIHLGFSFGDGQNDEFSSGEFAILSMISRFYSLPKNFFRRQSSSLENLLVVIDEGELYLHPSWQKQFINLLVTTLPAIFPDSYVQILLTSHSPFILSDLTKNRVTFLKKVNGKGVNADALEQSQTFAGNIHTLLADSFFMEEGFMGDFAKSKLNAVIKELNSHARIAPERRDEIRKIIQSVGEPLIKNTLLDLYEQKFRLDVDDRLTALEKRGKR